MPTVAHHHRAPIRTVEGKRVHIDPTCTKDCPPVGWCPCPPCRATQANGPNPDDVAQRWTAERVDQLRVAARMALATGHPGAWVTFRMLADPSAVLDLVEKLERLKKLEKLWAEQQGAA